ncbi:MAG TPA: hypothetical protein VNO34_09145 [Actinomycetota bacterium]|nr:hypothetical protein [Actinomycetota bacterium]
MARAIRSAFPDLDFSIVDLTSLAVIQRLGLRQAAAFVADLPAYRFGPRLEPSFTVVR